MHRKNYTRKLFKTKNKKRKTKIRKQKTKIRKQKTKIMRGGAQDAQSIKYIDYLFNVMNKSNSSLDTLSANLDEDITEGLLDKIDDLHIHRVEVINDKSSVKFKTTFYQPLRSEIEKMKKDDLYTADNTLFIPIRQLAHNYLVFLTRDLPDIRKAKNSKFNEKLDKDIVEIIKAISEILFSIDSIIYINKSITDTSDHRGKYIKELMTNVHKEYKGHRFGYSKFLVPSTPFASSITKAYEELKSQIVTDERDYVSINKSATALLDLMSKEIVVVMRQQQQDDKTSLLDIYDLARNIPKDMYYLINIINISKMITKIKEEMAASRIQRHTRTRIKSMRDASRAATMSRAATRLQAQQRSKISRREALITDELQLQEKQETEREKRFQEELEMISRV
jgi:hypothetical protein